MAHTVAGVASEKLASVDAARGWAILLVILGHSMGPVPNLPYPVAKITAFGIYGVQLFFIVSAVTLLLSWHRQDAPFTDKIRKFFIRRFFRIAPMYYLGALLYYFLRPPQYFDSTQLLLSLSFINAWSPAWLPTTDHDWQVVPGGWSISVEFCFYFLFPLLGLLVGSLRSSLVLLTGAIALLLLAYPVGQQIFFSRYGDPATDNFLFFWLPNQLGIFALGFVIYALLTSAGPRVAQLREIMARQHYLLLLAGLAVFLLLTQVGISKHVSMTLPWLPRHVLVSLAFCLIVLALLTCPRPSRLFVNPFMIKLGEVSFSAYVLHWMVLDGVHYFGDGLGREVTDYQAIGYFGIIFAVVLLVTFLLSRLTYRFIERPFIDLSRKWSRKAPALTAPLPVK